MLKFMLKISYVMSNISKFILILQDCTCHKNQCPRFIFGGQKGQLFFKDTCCSTLREVLRVSVAWTFDQKLLIGLLIRMN